MVILFRKEMLAILLLVIMGGVSCKTDKPDPMPTPLVLSLDNSEIFANDEQKVSFVVTQNDQEVTAECKIFNAETDEALPGHTFSTDKPGTYKFYAKKGNQKSNEISVLAKEVPDNVLVVTLKSMPESPLKVGETVRFTVDCNGEDVTDDSEIFLDGEQSKLPENTFVATEAGNYLFYAVYKGEKSNKVTVTFAEDPAKEVTLSVNPATIPADGTTKAIFKVEQQGRDVTSEAKFFAVSDDKALPSNEFTSTQAGDFAFYAKYNDIRSNTVSVKVEPVAEKNLVLSASSTSIKANGTDASVFTVMQGAEDVTGQCVFYANGNKLVENRLVSSHPGTVVVYAEKGTLKSNEVTIEVKEVSSTGTSVVFADGVTLDAGWYDVNKKGNGQTHGDINMCWAASSSNIIQWWQDRYVAAGNSLPEGAITGPGSTYELALMEMFHEQWDNSMGGHAYHAVTWYFEGRNIMKEASPGSNAQPKSGFEGGFFKNIWSEILPHVYHDYTYLFYNDLISTDFNSYSIWGKGSNLHGDERLKKFSELLVTFMDRGIASLGVSLAANLSSSHHATTIWGYEIDNATGLVKKVWITDSDDMKSEPKKPVLHEYSLSVDESNGTIKLSGAPYGACYAVSLYPVSGYKK